MCHCVGHFRLRGVGPARRGSLSGSLCGSRVGHFGRWIPSRQHGEEEEEEEEEDAKDIKSHAPMRRRSRQVQDVHGLQWGPVPHCSQTSIDVVQLCCHDSRMMLKSKCTSSRTPLQEKMADKHAGWKKHTPVVSSCIRWTCMACSLPFSGPNFVGRSTTKLGCGSSSIGRKL